MISDGLSIFPNHIINQTDAFDLDAGIWTLAKENTKTRSSIRIPLAEPVIAWLKEARIFSFGKPFVFPARRLVR